MSATRAMCCRGVLRAPSRSHFDLWRGSWCATWILVSWLQRLTLVPGPGETGILKRAFVQYKDEIHSLLAVLGELLDARTSSSPSRACCSEGI